MTPPSHVYLIISRSDVELFEFKFQNALVNFCFLQCCSADWERLPDQQLSLQNKRRCLQYLVGSSLIGMLRLCIYSHYHLHTLQSQLFKWPLAIHC